MLDIKSILLSCGSLAPLFKDHKARVSAQKGSGTIFAQQSGKVKISLSCRHFAQRKRKETMLGNLVAVLAACGVLLVIVGLWFFITYWLTPHLEHPDGKARITGRCGDTMEIDLKFRGDRVSETSYWTDGCAYSLSAVCAAVDLAKGKTPDEIIEIDSAVIQKTLGGLPRDQTHCADLAAEALQSALEDYILRSQK
jgi:nitrogen fixation NifU-like protein